jgi:hypothetical protein
MWVFQPHPIIQTILFMNKDLVLTTIFKTKPLPNTPIILTILNIKSAFMIYFNSHTGSDQEDNVGNHATAHGGAHPHLSAAVAYLCNLVPTTPAVKSIMFELKIFVSMVRVSLTLVCMFRTRQFQEGYHQALMLCRLLLLVFSVSQN